MNLSKIIAWAGTILFLLIILGYSREFCRADPQAKGIFQLETAGRTEGKIILSRWHDDGAYLQQVARTITVYDFFFIIFYVLLLAMLSNNQMYKEEWLTLSSLLRLNTPLAILTGLLDITENIILLHNIHHWEESQPYIGSVWITIPKFILAGWIILIWLISLIKGLIKK